jgi:hypothetical protein
MEVNLHTFLNWILGAHHSAASLGPGSNLPVWMVYVYWTGCNVVAKRKVPVPAKYLFKKYVNMVIFQFLTAANMKMDVFWGNLPCSLVEID